jgi:hypothetical protein
MVKDIPCGDVGGSDEHDYENQIAEDSAGFINYLINPGKKFIYDLTHDGRLSLTFRVPGSIQK